MNRFSPIAVIGQSCVLPGAFTPGQLWEGVLTNRDFLSDPPEGYWRVPFGEVLANNPGDWRDRTISVRGGYVRGFESVFDPSGLGISSEDIRRLAPHFQWVVHGAREALRDAGHENPPPTRVGLILGNLGYPSAEMSRLAEAVWLGGSLPDPRNRFSASLPAQVAAKILRLQAGSMSLDAACASSLYAIKIACDWLHDGRADLMIAGGVNGADDLFLHLGFTALKALSPTGQSRPFHRCADGLVPSQGAAFVVLKRLQDANAAGDTIAGVIRGIGLSNDGRTSDLLAPSEEGQWLAMQRAYAMSGLSPTDISLVECHATGTALGDAVEVRSMRRIFLDRKDLPIGSLKSNLGHLITASGSAGLIKVLAALEAEVLPPMRAADDPLDLLKSSPFRLLSRPEPWTCSKPRRAAVSSFGFGGNNAHLIVEQWQPEQKEFVAVPSEVPRGALAIVGLGVIVADGHDTNDFARDLFAGRSRVRDLGDGRRGAAAEVIALDPARLRFPPKDLEHALPQQLLLLKAAQEALDEAGELPSERTGVLVGTECDGESARHGVRWRLNEWLRQHSADLPVDRRERVRNQIGPSLEAVRVVGTMLNITANRINVQFNFTAFGFTVLAGELSGLAALELAKQLLQARELDAAVVGAVDLSCEPVHEAAIQAFGNAERHVPGDAAVVCVLKRLEDARREGNRIYAVLNDAQSEQANVVIGPGPAAFHLAPLFGHSWAAAGLLQVAAAALACCCRAIPPSERQEPAPWLPSHGPTSVQVEFADLHGTMSRVLVTECFQASDTPRSSHPPSVPADHRGWVASLTHARKYSTSSKSAVIFPAHMPVPRLPLGNFGMLPPSTTASQAAALTAWTDLAAAVALAHREWIVRQSAVHRVFLDSRENALKQLGAFSGMSIGMPELSPTLSARTPASGISPTDSVAALQSVAPGKEESSVSGLQFDRQQLEILASGAISSLLGPLFRTQDDYPRQVRLPEPPLLLVDRVIGIDGEPGSLGKGSIRTETDIHQNSWYLHDGYMPSGIMVEAGQADLLLISWLGIDFLNRGERVYRLLGCELTYHGRLPRPGDTLHYDIHINGYSQEGEVRLFFFQSDCRIDGTLYLTVRHGQAGFFTDDELRNSQGVLWDPEISDRRTAGPLDPPGVACTRSAFTQEQVRAYSEGKVYECFGPGFERAQTHVCTPRIQPGRMLLIDAVTHLDVRGGPRKRGYLRALRRIHETDWFFSGHFKNDPCMPGTLVFEGCLQAMAFYLTGLGFTLDKDGWRFEAVTEEPFLLRCRGQVVPSSRELVYEIFVEEVLRGPYPTLYAELLCTVDGLKAFHCRRMGYRLVPDWPARNRPDLLAAFRDGKPAATVDGFCYDSSSIIACAWGRPSDAFGPTYQVFDGPRRLPRLPGPPYLLVSRIARVAGRPGAMNADVEVEVEYDVPSKAWYFADNGSARMPFCVLLEIALQSCGWLATYAGCTVNGAEDLFFRNLDGTATVTAEVLPAAETVMTRARLVKISRSAGMILVFFEVECRHHGRQVLSLQTDFGFFPAEALRDQVGLPAAAAEVARLQQPSDFFVDLTSRPGRYFRGALRLPEAQRLMLDRITGFWPEGGKAQLGRLRAEKDVDANAWFFKAHFFQDPVQPGSLGLDAMLQLLQFYLIHRGLHARIPNPRFESPAFDQSLTWKYRGQVLPENRTIVIEMDICAEGRDDAGLFAVAEAWLWVDGRRIYHAQNLTARIVSEHVARHTHVRPAPIADGLSAVRTTMPRNRYPLQVATSDTQVAATDAAEPFLDLSSVRAFWHDQLGLKTEWPMEDIFLGLADRFVNRLILEDPGMFETMRRQNVIYLANHQVAIESPLFSFLVSGIARSPMMTVAKAEHRSTWIGRLQTLAFSRPGIRDPRTIVYFDRQDKESMLEIVERLKSAMCEQHRSVLVHIQGTRSLSCREPVKTMSAVFLDLGLSADVPMVPVRFVGGLPVERAAARLEFPFGYGRQDFYLGKPIQPAELRRISLLDRKKLILDAINHLGIPIMEERPSAPDPGFAGEVQQWMSQHRVGEAEAVLFKILEKRSLTGEMQTILQGIRAGHICVPGDAPGNWLAELAKFLYPGLVTTTHPFPSGQPRHHPRRG